MRNPLTTNNKKNPADRNNRTDNNGQDPANADRGVESTTDSPALNVGIDTPKQRRDVPADLNSPTVTGFTSEGPGLKAPQEDSDLRKLSLDEATKLRSAVDSVIGYQTGVAYRQDFTSGLDVLRTFGFIYDVDRADADATRVQDEVLAREAGQVHSED